MAFLPGQRHELIVAIEHELTCQDCYNEMVAFCKEYELEQLSVYRPTRPSRNNSAVAVSGGSAMKSALCSDLTAERIAHWPCGGKPEFKPRVLCHPSTGNTLPQKDETNYFRCKCGCEQ